MRKSGGNTRGNATIAALAAIFALASPAWAQTASPPTAPTQAPPQTQQTPAHATSGWTNCDEYLPAGVAIPPNAQPTLFSFRLALDGNFHDLAIYRSSGSRDLDKAALACAGGIHGEPFKRAGIPTEIYWIGAISWNGRLHTYVESQPSGALNICNYRNYPRLAIRRGIQGDATVSYTIAKDGGVKNITIAQSAGDDSLDKASIDCVSAFRFFPVIHDGSPIEIDRTVVERWRLH